MANKIKEIFSDDMYSENLTLHFDNHESYKKFMAALEVVSTDRQVVPVNGITSITAAVNHQGEVFPIEELSNISKFFIAPSPEQVTIPLTVDGEEKIVTLWRTRTKERVLLHSDPDSIVVFKLDFILDDNKHILNYKIQFDKANNISDVADSFSIAEAFLSYLYKQDNKPPTENDTNLLENLMEYFRRYKGIFKRLSIIEREFSLSLSPTLLRNISQEEQQDIDELYLLLFERKVIRLNSKLNFIDWSSFNVENDNLPDVGSNIAMVFSGFIEFSFLNQTIKLFTANMVVNAIVKEVQKDTDIIKVLFGDTDSKPMYISLTAYKTEEEAEQEKDHIMEHNESYINAIPSSEYIKQMYGIRE